MRPSKLTGFFVVGSLLGSTLLLTQPGTASAGTTRLLYLAHSYATNVFGGSTVAVGKTANAVLGCVTNPPVHHENGLASVDGSPAFTTGTVFSTVDGKRSGGQSISRATSRVQQISLLGGLITADEVRAVSQTLATKTGFQVDTTGTELLNLNVLGQPVGNVAPNTQIDLPLLGYVVLNEQKHRSTAQSKSLTVNMIHAYVTLDNPLGFDKGLQVVLGHATSGMGSVSGPLGGKAYGTSVDVGSTLLSGQSAVQYLPCLGTDGVVRSNSATLISLPGVIGVDAITDTAKGVVTDRRARGAVKSVVQGLDLLGLVSADAITAATHARFVHGKRHLNALGSGFTNLQVADHPEISDDVARNTQIDLAGIGTLWLFRVVREPHTIRVRMIEIQLGEGNTLGLPAGSDIQVGAASIAVY